MSAIDAIAIVRRYHAALNAFAPEEVKSMFAPEAEYQSPVIGVTAGRDAILESMADYFAEYPDQISIDETMSLVKPGVVRSVWRLKATSRSTGEPYLRQGVEHVMLTPQGQILRVEVADL